MSAMCRSFLKRLSADESGQSLIVITASLSVLIGMAAFAIDAGSWMVNHHRAQVVADAAALAAANCLANPGSSSGSIYIDGTLTTVPACSSSTDTADATTVAEDYARANGVPLTAPSKQITFDTTNDSVTIQASATSSSFFANFFGIHSTTQSAAAQASWKVGSPGSSACTTQAQAANDCYAIYAANQTCGSNNGWVTNSTSETINGAVHSQGSLNISNGSFSFNGPITYSSGNCTYTKAGNANIASGGSYQTPTAGGNQPAASWPLDYSTIFPACGGGQTYQCTGPGGTPSYCTDAASSYSFNWSSRPTGIYCAYGSGTPSQPTTWNGTVSFSNGANLGSSSAPQPLTVIAGSVSASSSSMHLQPAAGADNCLVYATDANPARGDTIEFQNGNYSVTGAMFAPNGTIKLTSTSASAGFLEAQNVVTENLSFSGFSGDGPIATATSSATGSGSDTLIQ